MPCSTPIASKGTLSQCKRHNSECWIDRRSTAVTMPPSQPFAAACINAPTRRSTASRRSKQTTSMRTSAEIGSLKKSVKPTLLLVLGQPVDGHIVHHVTPWPKRPERATNFGVEGNKLLAIHVANVGSITGAQHEIGAPKILNADVWRQSGLDGLERSQFRRELLAQEG